MLRAVLGVRDEDTGSAEGSREFLCQGHFRSLILVLAARHLLVMESHKVRNIQMSACTTGEIGRRKVWSLLSRSANVHFLLLITLVT